MLIILFGLAGTGKNFVGNILAKHFNFYHWDADQVLTVEMKEYIKNKQPFKQEMRDELTQNILDKISQISENHPNLVISQALIKEKNRNEILKKFPNALFIHVKADLPIIFKRLKDRGDWVDEAYAKKMISRFDEPKLPHKILLNNNDEDDVVNQLKQIL